MSKLNSRKWNKVQVTAWNRSEHKFSVYYIAPETYLPGDSVTIHTRRGTYPGTIAAIVDTNVCHYDTNARIEKRNASQIPEYPEDNRPTTKSNNKCSKEQEEINMMINEIFTIVTVKHTRSGKSNNLYTTLDVHEGDIVAFTTDIRLDKKDEFMNSPQWHTQMKETCDMHVGVVTNVYPPEAIERPTINSAHFSYVTAVINTSHMYKDYEKYTEAVGITNKLNQIKKQFEARKIYEILASSDPEAKALLGRLDELSGKKVPTVPGAQF